MGHKIKNTDNNSKMKKISQNETNVSISEKVNTVLSDFIDKWDATILDCGHDNNYCYLICDQFGFTKMSILLPIFKKNKISFYIKYNVELCKCMLVLFYD